MPYTKISKPFLLTLLTLMLIVLFITIKEYFQTRHYIQKSQVARVYGEMSAVKSAVENSIFNEKTPVTTSAEEEQHPEKNEWVGWSGSDMVEHFELKSIKKDGTIYWYMVSTFGQNADSLLHGSQLVLFRDGLYPEDNCIDSKTKTETCTQTKAAPHEKQQNKTPETLTSSSIEETDIKQQGQWYCRFYGDDKKNMSKYIPKPCSIVLEKFQSIDQRIDQLFVEDEKGNRLIN